MIQIEDAIHCEYEGDYATFGEAVAELRRRASIPWDQPPNRAPCTSWKRCGREYWVVEFDSSQEPWKLRRQVAVLNVSAAGIDWQSGYEQEWTAADGGESHGKVAEP